MNWIPHNLKTIKPTNAKPTYLANNVSTMKLSISVLSLAMAVSSVCGKAGSFRGYSSDDSRRSEDDVVDVLVVGGGLAGLLAAYRKSS